MLNKNSNEIRYFDIRLKLFRILKRFSFLLIILFIIHYSLFDTFLIQTDVSSPLIQSGDRVLISKISNNLPFSIIFKHDYGERVIAKYPSSQTLSILRVAGKPGDTVSVNNGVISTSGIQNSIFQKRFPLKIQDTYLSNDYSPRDNMLPVIVPKKGDTIFIPSLGTRDIIYAISIMRQENPTDSFELKKTLLINDTIKNDFNIKSYYRYFGLFKNIPVLFSNDRFFWEGLIKYLNSTIKNGSPYINLEIIKNGSELVTRYTVKHDSYFLVSDNNHNGLDSRYIGPISKKNIKGRAIIVLWSSIMKHGSILPKLKIRRFLKTVGKN